MHTLILLLLSSVNVALAAHQGNTSNVIQNSGKPKLGQPNSLPKKILHKMFDIGRYNQKGLQIQIPSPMTKQYTGSSGSQKSQTADYISSRLYAGSPTKLDINLIRKSFDAKNPPGFVNRQKNKFNRQQNKFSGDKRFTGFVKAQRTNKNNFKFSNRNRIYNQMHSMLKDRTTNHRWWLNTRTKKQRNINKQFTGKTGAVQRNNKYIGAGSLKRKQWANQGKESGINRKQWVNSNHGKGNGSNRLEINQPANYNRRKQSESNDMNNKIQGGNAIDNTGAIQGNNKYIGTGSLNRKQFVNQGKESGVDGITRKQWMNSNQGKGSGSNRLNKQQPVNYNQRKGSVSNAMNNKIQRGNAIDNTGAIQGNNKYIGAGSLNRKQFVNQGKGSGGNGITRKQWMNYNHGKGSGSNRLNINQSVDYNKRKGSGSNHMNNKIQTGNAKVWIQSRHNQINKKTANSVGTNGIQRLVNSGKTTKSYSSGNNNTINTNTASSANNTTVAANAGEMEDYINAPATAHESEDYVSGSLSNLGTAMLNLQHGKSKNTTTASSPQDGESENTTPTATSYNQQLYQANQQEDESTESTQTAGQVHIQGENNIPSVVEELQSLWVLDSLFNDDDDDD